MQTERWRRGTEMRRRATNRLKPTSRHTGLKAETRQNEENTGEKRGRAGRAMQDLYKSIHLCHSNGATISGNKWDRGQDDFAPPSSVAKVSVQGLVLNERISQTKHHLRTTLFLFGSLSLSGNISIKFISVLKCNENRTETHRNQ